MTKTEKLLVLAALQSCQRKADYESHRYHVSYWKTYDTDLVNEALKIVKNDCKR